MNETESQVEAKTTQRLEAFSDGVFAIAVTLLVLEIRLPSREREGGLLNHLLELWPAYLAYLISFITIAIMWVNHDMLLRDIKRSDRPFLFLNALLLMMITFLNFPTAVLAEYLQQPEANVAAMFYSGTLLLIAILFNSLWWYATRNRLVSVTADPAWQKRVRIQYVFGPLVYGAALIVASFSPLLSVAITFALAVYFAVATRSD
jgi:uncharacterized membrane protein